MHASPSLDLSVKKRKVSRGQGQLSQTQFETRRPPEGHMCVQVATPTTKKSGSWRSPSPDALPGYRNSRTPEPRFLSYSKCKVLPNLNIRTIVPPSTLAISLLRQKIVNQLKRHAMSHHALSIHVVSGTWFWHVWRQKSLPFFATVSLQLREEIQPHRCQDRESWECIVPRTGRLVGKERLGRAIDGSCFLIDGVLVGCPSTH